MYKGGCVTVDVVQYDPTAEKKEYSVLTAEKTGVSTVQQLKKQVLVQVF